MCSKRTIVRTAGLTACLCICLGSAFAGRAIASGEDQAMAQTIKPKHLLEAPAGDLGGGDPRGNCGNIIYQNTTSGAPLIANPIYNISDGSFPWHYTGDDVAVAGVDRFVCQIAVELGTADINVTPSFPYILEFWDVEGTTVCSDSGATLLYQTGVQIATGFSGSFGIDRYEVPIPNIPVSNNFWVVIRTSNHSENPYIVVRGAGPTIGTTANFFYVGYENNRCDSPAHFLIYGGTPTPDTGFSIELQATQGPTGSCCTQSGTNPPVGCADGVLLGNCGAYNQSWNALPGCPQGCTPCDVVCTGSNLTEGEPTCSANYIDNTDNGCSFTEGSQSFINVSCGADICGTYGTYTFLNGTVTQNRRDNDYYRLVLTSTKQVTFSATGESAMNVTIFVPTLGPGMGPCDDIATITPSGTASGGSSRGCQAATATVCVPAGTYYLVARASTTSGIPCGLDYRATVTCAACTLPTGACCLPTGCFIQEEVRCLQQGGSYRGNATTCPPTPPCPPPPTNETCLTKTTVPAITTNSTTPIDTTFALTEDTSNIAECNNLPIFKDIWFDYKIVAANQPAGVTFGRIAVSTFDSCFDSRVLVYRVPTCTDTQANQCASLIPLQCNDDINTDRGNVASYVEIVDDGDAVQPSPGECFKIRVGGATSTDGGAGNVRVDFVPSLPAPWSSSSGRCCFPNGSCSIGAAGGGGATDCVANGGFLTATTNFGEGDPAFTEYSTVGCHTLPCPAAGEACFNALNLNTILGGGFGTTTRAITNRLYYKYQIPFAAAPGSGITFSTCGSDFNTAIAVYASGAIDQTTGECLGTPLAKNDNCTPSDTSAAGAGGVPPIASCFAAGETDSCLCLTVGNIGQATGPGSVIYIEVGASNGITGSTQATVDPVPANCGTAVTASLTVTASAQCFVCNIVCTGTPEGEPVCGPNYTDTTDAGCNASPATFVDVSCGQTICGQAGNYVFTNGTTASNFRDLDWYRFSVTSAKNVTITLNASFQSLLALDAAPNLSSPCDTTTLNSVTSTSGCLTTSITQAVCAGTFYVIVGPAVFTGVDCGSPYKLTISCGAPVAASCCKGDMDNDGVLTGKDIALFVKNLLLPPIASLPVNGCYNLNTCRADMNGDFVLTTADIPLFVTALLGKTACPNLPSCTDPAKCHLSNQSGGSVSDIGTSTGCNKRVVDDFKADASGNIVNICWYGFYLNFLTGTVCTPQGGSSADAFCVTIYNDNAGVPGTVRGGPFCSLAVTKTDTGVDIPFTGFGNAREWKYSAAITAVPVTAGTCYWIEIVNSTSGNCCWLWSASGFTNDVSASHTGGPAGTPNYVAADLGTGDLAFCLNDIRINKRDCGLPQGRCCYPNQADPTHPLCTVTDVFQCSNVLHGSWSQGGNCTAPCSPPAANNCADANLVATNQVLDGSTVGQTTDGPQPTCDTNNIAPDVWYRWTALVTGPAHVSMCASAPGYDSILAVYTGTCGTLNQVACNDDGCGGGSTSFVGAAPPNGTASPFNATAGITYLIRVLGWNGHAGAYSMIIQQP